MITIALIALAVAGRRYIAAAFDLVGLAVVGSAYYLRAGRDAAVIPELVIQDLYSLSDLFIWLFTAIGLS